MGKLEHELIASMQRDRSLWGSCPSCGGEFRLAEGSLFPIDEMTAAGKQAVTKREEAIEEVGKKIATLRRNIEKAGTGARASGVGKVIEKAAPLLRGFPHDPRDCRFLGEPIDYLVFRGLAGRGVVQHVTFLDIKTQGARLQDNQKSIRDAVEGGKVDWEYFRT